MATATQKIDSNVTGLRYQEELCIGVANPNNPWLTLEPNSYEDFGGEFTTVAMTGVDRYGFEMSAVTPDGPRPIRVAFPVRISTTQEARTALVRMLGDARVNNSTVT